MNGTYANPSTVSAIAAAQAPMASAQSELVRAGVRRQEQPRDPEAADGEQEHGRERGAQRGLHGVEDVAGRDVWTPAKPARTKRE